MSLSVGAAPPLTTSSRQRGSPRTSTPRTAPSRSQDAVELPEQLQRIDDVLDHLEARGPVERSTPVGQGPRVQVRTDPDHTTAAGLDHRDLRDVAAVDGLTPAARDADQVADPTADVDEPLGPVERALHTLEDLVRSEAGVADATSPLLPVPLV